MQYQILPYVIADIKAIKKFTDVAIGENYYSESELEKIYEKSIFRVTGTEEMCTFVLKDLLANEIMGVRITYPPGNWSHGKGNGLCPELWNVDQAKVAYFQSVFIHESLAGQGWGKQLSLKSLEVLARVGTRAVVCHSWVESPKNSSGRYLRDLGFISVQFHKEYWKDIDYICTRCGKPCLCTAEEMIKYL